MIHKVLSDIECSNLCKAHLRKIPVEAMPKFSLRDCDQAFYKDKRGDSHFLKSDSIVLRRTTLQSTLLNTSQRIPPRTLLTWIHSVPHQQQSPSDKLSSRIQCMGSVRLLTWSIIRDTNGKTIITKLLRSYNVSTTRQTLV